MDKWTEKQATHVLSYKGGGTKSFQRILYFVGVLGKTNKTTCFLILKSCKKTGNDGYHQNEIPTQHKTEP
jgi:hypothetical protein